MEQGQDIRVWCRLGIDEVIVGVYSSFIGDGGNRNLLCVHGLTQTDHTYLFHAMDYSIPSLSPFIA